MTTEMTAPNTDSFVVVKHHKNLVKYVDQLQRKNAESLSFYPMQVFEREAERGRILLALLNGDPCGYIYIGSSSDGTMRCHQVCIQYDARRRFYGAQLVALMESEAIAANATWIRLRCGFDLEANDFWKSLGYSCTEHVLGGIRRMRTINVWTKVVGHALFGIVAIEPAKGKTDATVWAKHKQTGIVTQFVRGKAMSEYRTAIVNASKAAPK